ncbi:MAG: hypothetical protein KAV87_28170, partial [Desulfobacteraceae bacterium]|nr:hypothetical protein [Desulfobacteraceae bacterium]
MPEDYFSDDFFSGDVTPEDEFSDDFFDITPTEPSTYSGEGFLGAMGDLGRGLWEGTLDDLVGGAMKAGEWIAEEGSVLEDAFAAGGDYIQGLLDQNPELFEESATGRAAREANWLNPRGWLHPSMRSVGPMVGAALTGPAAPVTLGLLYHGRTAQESLERSYDEFPEWDDDKRLRYANTKGVIEGGGEAIQMALFRGLWKHIPTPAKGALLKGVSGATKPGVQFAKKFLGMVAGEELTETGQEFTGRATDYWYGLEQEMPTVTQSFKDVFGPTLIASMVMGLGGSAAQIKADQRLNQNLSHIDTPRDVRTQAAAEVYQRAKKKDKELAKQWWESIQFNLQLNQPVIIGADVDYTQQLDPEQTALDEVGEEAPAAPPEGIPTPEEPFDDTGVPFEQVAAEEAVSFEVEPAVDVTAMMDGPAPEAGSPFVDLAEPLPAEEKLPEIPSESARELKQEAIQEVEAQMANEAPVSTMDESVRDFNQRVDQVYSEKVQQWAALKEDIPAEPEFAEDVTFGTYDERLAAERDLEGYEPELPGPAREAFAADRAEEAARREAIDEQAVPADVKKQLRKEAAELTEEDPAIQQMRGIRKKGQAISKASFGADFDLDTLKDIPGHSKLFTNAGTRTVDEVADELGYESNGAMLESFRRAGTQKDQTEKYYNQLVSQWVKDEELAEAAIAEEREISELKEAVTGIPKKLSITREKPPEAKISAGDVKKAFPKAEIDELPDGYIVTLPNKSKIAVNLVGEIMINREKAKEDYGYTDEQLAGLTAAGTWQAFTDTDGVITLSKIAQVKDLNHEAFHAAMEMVLTPDEIADVLGKYEREEDVAMAYGDWAVDQDAPHSAFQKIANFFRNLVVNLMGGEKAVFARIKAGKPFTREIRARLAERIPVSQWTPDIIAEEMALRNKYALGISTDYNIDLEELPLTEIKEKEGYFSTGVPVTFKYLHNRESATELYGIPTTGAPFGREYEPSGQYVIAISDDYLAREQPEQYETGEITFDNPLVIETENWKEDLSEAYGGLAGRDLSAALLSSGFDGVVTVSKHGTSEILNLTNFQYDRAKYSLNHDNHELNIATKSQQQLWYSDMAMALNENLQDKPQTQDKWQKQISDMADRTKDKRVAVRDDQNRPTGEVRVVEGHIPGKFRRSELEWSGVLPWLSAQSGKVSKDQVMAYLDANLPKLGEVVLSEYSPDFKNEVRQYFDDIQDDLIANDGDTAITDDMGNTLLIGMEFYDPLEDTATVTVSWQDGTEVKNYLGFEEFITDVTQNGAFDEFVWPTVRHDALQIAGPATGYRELVITLDGEDLGFRRADHYPIKNVVVHARFNTRVDAVGRRTLHVEEIQSDHLQALRTKEGIPEAPFLKEWPALAVKRLLRWATDNGYDQMTWTTGAQQADRFSNVFRMSVDKINWKLAGGVYEIDAEKDGKESFYADFNMDGIAVSDIYGFAGRPHMSEVIGKDLSGKILAGEKSKGTFEGDSLAIGAAGFQAFYDNELVNTVKKIVKPFGSTVSTTEIIIDEGLPDVTVPVHSVEVTPKMKESVPGGASMWSRAKYSLGASEPWYSTLGRAAGELKQQKGSPDQMLAMLKKSPGVKQEEIDWVGLEGWMLGKKSVTKQEIVAYLDANDVGLEEVVKGDYSQELKDLYASLEERNNGADFDDWAETDQDLWYSRRGAPKDVKFADYQLPGGERYREMLLALPDKATIIYTEDNVLQISKKQYPAQQKALEYIIREKAGFAADELAKTYTGGHWDEPNVLVHIRFNERTDADGQKVLFIEEIQSDLHQAGRKKGYAISSKEKAEIDQMISRIDEVGGIENLPAEERLRAEEMSQQLVRVGVVPDFPFKKTWSSLALRRMITFGTQNGFDRIAWTPGSVQADRYDLSKQVDEIRYTQNEDGSYSIAAIKGDASIFSRNKVEESDLEDVVGKEVASKIIEGDGEAETFTDGTRTGGRVLSGLDLQVGGKGMIAFYDSILPSVANKLIKKYGARVGETTLKFDNAPEEVVEKWAAI